MTSTPTRPERPSGSNVATLTAFLLLMFCAAGLFALIMVVNPFVMGVLVILAGFFLLILLQYMIWGRWFANLQTQRAILDSSSGAPEGLDFGPGTRTLLAIMAGTVMLAILIANRSFLVP